MQSRELLATKAAAKDLFLNTWFDFHFPYGPLKIISPGNCCSGKGGCPDRQLRGQTIILRSPFHFCLVSIWRRVFSLKIISPFAREGTAVPIFAFSAKGLVIYASNTVLRLIQRFLSFHFRNILKILRLKSASQVSCALALIVNEDLSYQILKYRIMTD